MVNEEFKIYIDILRKYDALLDKFPRNISFPLFEVNLEPVLKVLKKTIKDHIEKIFNKFET